MKLLWNLFVPGEHAEVHNLFVLQVSQGWITLLHRFLLNLLLDQKTKWYTGQWHQKLYTNSICRGGAGVFSPTFHLHQACQYIHYICLNINLVSYRFTLVLKYQNEKLLNRSSLKFKYSIRSLHVKCSWSMPLLQTKMRW